MRDRHDATRRQGRAPINKAFIDALRDELIAKLTEEWPVKWAKDHGLLFAGVDGVPSQEAFFDALRIDIGGTLSQTWGERDAVTRNVSIDTLSRFFDETYDKSFTPKTLNALAIYAGYADFADFKKQQQTNLPAPVPHITIISLIAPRPQPSDGTDLIYSLPQRRPGNWWWLAAGLGCLLAYAGYYYVYQYRPNRTLTASEIAQLTFNVTKRSNAYNPSRVTFSYDFSRLGIDTLLINFNGNKDVDEHKFAKLSQKQGNYVLDFYKPGLHHVDVYHQKQLLKRVPVWVKSHGWACWYEVPNWTNPNFTYREFYREGRLFLHPAKIQDPSHRNYYVLNTKRVQDFGIKTDSLTIDYDLKYSPDDYAISCYDHLLTLGFGDGTRFLVDFSRPGCNDFSGKNQPPTRSENGYALAFPRLFYEWAHLKVQWKANRLQVWVNNELLTDSPNNVPIANLIDFGFGSKGSAMYDNVRISNSYTNRTVFADDFNTVPKKHRRLLISTLQLAKRFAELAKAAGRYKCLSNGFLAKVSPVTFRHESFLLSIRTVFCACTCCLCPSSN